MIMAIFSINMQIRELLQTISGSRFQKLSAGCLILGCLYVFVRCFYNVFFHPLRNIPGPKTHAAAIVTIYYYRLRGIGPFHIADLHNKYGPIVRLAPDEVSFIDPAAWKDIYGHRVSGKGNFYKDPVHNGPDVSGVPGINRAIDGDHTRLRRLFAHAFSDRGLKAQEPLIKEHVNLLVSRLEECRIRQRDNPTSPDSVIDMAAIYNFTTFDVMSDLSFGEPLGLLQHMKYVPWVEAINGIAKTISYMHAINRWPAIAYLLNYFMPASVRNMRLDHYKFCVDRVERRLRTEVDRPDLFGIITDAGADKEMLREEMYSCASDFMVAGTETQATLLTGLTFMLCSHPEKLKKLVAEIRDFKNPEDITLSTLQKLPYLNGCMEEALRLYPPVPVGTMRLVPPEGAMICGEFISGGTVVEFAHHAAYHSTFNFVDAQKFVPERWLPNADERYLLDKKNALAPFGFGPRICIGKNLAYHEMRVILANVIWNFDLNLVDPEQKWLDQDIHEFWVKPPLHVRLETAKR
ncbi:cytochrome P450 [Halenospora varia]|nr:cytochrome P450 [Halenospora varia]